MGCKCRRCNRPLKREPYASMGIGKICARKEREIDAVSDGSNNFPMFFDKPVFGTNKNGIFLERRNGLNVTNVSHLLTHHSPTGMGWGYPGSGCADLALNIVESYLRFSGFIGDQVKTAFGETCYRLSMNVHQAFKEDFLMTISEEEGGEIAFEDIDMWMKCAVENEMKRYDF